jgi:aspartyl-tRNA(Asn)/glutamyl-tRNA(Gln) amidotransferase subunit C
MPENNLDIDYIAQLARLELSESEKALYKEQLGAIIGYVSQLQKVNTQGIQPMSHAFPIYNVYREDTPGKTLSINEALKLAPKMANGQSATQENQWIVPKVVE